MVAAKPKRKADNTAEPTAAPKRFGTTVRLSEVVASGTRLEASCYALEARSAIETMQAAGLPLVPVYGPGGLCHKANNAFRFKRIFVEQEHGVPFFTSADIISIRQRPEKFLSKKQTKRLSDLVVKKHDILVSCSGTIGNVALVGESYSEAAFSQDALRLSSTEEKTAGYVAAFLRSYFGRVQLRGVVYGAVIQHIEPEHMTRIFIPDIHPILKASIGSRMLDAVKKRDDANAILDDAEELLIRHIGLSTWTDTNRQLNCCHATEVAAKDLNGRFDANYHSPLAKHVEESLRNTGVDIVSLGDEKRCCSIFAVTKFRKRVYVDHGGIPMLNSKQISQIDPIDVKRLAKGAHTKDMDEIELKENMITVSCSGTIGNVEIIPKYMDGWTANQHTLRVVSSSKMNPGYIYAWLASPYGKCLIKRFSYGAVILEVDRFMLRSLSVPLLDPKQMDEVGDMVLKANSLRNEAWELEQLAIKELESILEGKSLSAKG